MQANPCRDSPMMQAQEVPFDTQAAQLKIQPYVALLGLNILNDILCRKDAK